MWSRYMDYEQTSFQHCEFELEATPPPSAASSKAPAKALANGGSS